MQDIVHVPVSDGRGISNRVIVNSICSVHNLLLKYTCNTKTNCVNCHNSYKNIPANLCQEFVNANGNQRIGSLQKSGLELIAASTFNSGFEYVSILSAHCVYDYVSIIRPRLGWQTASRQAAAGQPGLLLKLTMSAYYGHILKYTSYELFISILRKFS